jgi:hypothetical protein
MGGLVSSFIEVHRAWVLLNRVEIPFIQHSGVGKTRGTRMGDFRIPGSREGSYTRVSKWKSLFDYLNLAYLCMTNRGFLPVDVSNLVGKVYPSAGVSNYSNSRVLGYGQLANCTWLLSRMIITHGEHGEWHDLTLHWFLTYLKFLFRLDLEN